MDVEMEVVECANCYMSFAVPQKFLSDRRKDHQTFYCPNKHSNFYPGKTDEEKLKEKLKLKEEQLAEKDRQLADVQEAARNLREARLEFIEKFLNEQFKKGAKGIALKDVAPQFGMKARELHELVQIHLAGFKCVRAGKAYQIVKNEKENK